MSDQYVESQLHHLLIEDARIAEQGIRVVRTDAGVSLVGEVESGERRELIKRIVAETFPQEQIKCDIGVTRVREPDDVEEL